MSKYEEGDQVLAKLPGSQEFVKAKIIGIRGSDKYRVKIRGGVEHTISVSDVKEVQVQRTSRSQSRGRGRTTAKSPARSSPSRKKSPARRSPARSPNSQGRKLPIRSARQAKVTIARLDVQKDNSSDTDRTEESESLNDEPATQSRLRDLKPRRSIRIMSNASKVEHDQKLQKLRGGDRAASLPVDKKTFEEGKDRSFSMQRDDDMKIHYESDGDADVLSEGKGKKKASLNLSKPQEWCGWFGALVLTLSTPACVLLLQLACMNDYCSAKNFRIPRPREWKLFLNQNAFLLYAGYLCYVAIMSVLPIGRLVDGQQTKSGTLQYRINGIWTLILTTAIFGGCVYQGYNIGDFLLKKSLAFTAAGVVYGTLLSLVLYIKAGRLPVSKLNIYGSTNSIIYNFWQGREVSPRIGPIDVKQLLFNAAVIGAILINLAAGVKIVKEVDSLEWNNLDKLNYAALASVILQTIYLLDGIIFEGRFLSSFEFTYEGAGYMLSVGYLIYPYLGTITTRYLLAHKIHQPLYLITFCTILFIIGLYILRASNNQKDEFRKNPFSPAVAHLETIPTSRGKRLIVSGFWGHVRHPNYLGDILVHWSLALLGSAPDILPFILAIFTTLLLIHRAVRDNARCEKRYGYAWEQYCQLVKYMIFYRVF